MTVGDEYPWYMDDARFEAGLANAPSAVVRQHAEHLLRDGYVVIKDSIARSLCAEAVAEFRDIEARRSDLFHPHRDEHGHYPRLINLHLASPALRRVFHDNLPALAVLDLMFGSPAALYTSLFYERGSAQELHRDTPYFTTRPEYRYFGMWVALEDVDLENGPLYVMEGGHLMSELDREALATELFGSPDHAKPISDLGWNEYQRRVVEQGHAMGLTVKPVPVTAGSTIIWHPQLPHGGFPIADLDRTRFSQVMHVTPKSVPVYHQDAFFNPKKPLPTEPEWSYRSYEDRDIAWHGVVGLGHSQSYPVDEIA